MNARQVLAGAAAGTLATVPMSLVMAGAFGTGLVKAPPPPEQITATAEQKTGLHRWLPPEAFDLRWVAAHFGYGAACGVLYSLARQALPRSEVLGGLLFGEAVWAGSYLGYLPAVGLYPPPQKDVPGRTAVMIAAHAVFGLATAEIDRRLEGRRPGEAGSAAR